MVIRIHYILAYHVPRIPKSIRSPKQLFQRSNGTLNTIFSHDSALLTIESVVTNVVTNIVPGEFQVASFNNGILHLITPSAALATRIKYSQRALISALRQRRNPYIVKKIKISVRPDIPERTETIRSAKPPSAENARYMADAAKYIGDESLRKALIKLSERASSDE